MVPLHVQDQLFYHPYKSWPRRVEVNLPKSQRCRLVKGRESAAADNRTAAAASAQLMRMQEVPPGCAHSEYVQMESTYQGFWVASRQKLLKYMDSRWASLLPVCSPCLCNACRSYCVCEGVLCVGIATLGCR